MEFINTPNAPAAIGPYSQGISTNGFCFFSGQIALTAKGDFIDGSVEEQTEQIFKNITALLTDQKLKKENIIKCTVFLADIDDFVAVNEIYASFFGDHKPARSCVAVAALPKGAKVEVEVIAIKS